MDDTPFVGRGAELVRLNAELEAARQGGRVLLVTGDAGVGKTRLLAEFASAAGGRARVLLGRGSPLGSAIPFSLVAEALESHLRELPAARVRELCGERGAALVPVLPSVAAAIGVGTSVPGRLATLEAFLFLVGSLAKDRALMVVLDDAHRADPSTWEFIAYLARNPPTAPVLLIAAVREGSDPSELADLGGLRKDGLADEMRLATLGRDDVTALARRTLGTESAAAWVFERTGGNALFTTALLDQLRADPGQREVPRSVRAQIESLTAGLERDGREVLATAAVLGHTFSLRTIARAIPTGAGRWLDELVRRGVLRERSQRDETVYDFAHPLIQEVAYDAIGAARRRELHEALSRTLADEPLAVRAYHAARGALRGDAAAIALVREAAREAERAQAHREALQHLTAARSLIPAGTPESREVLDEIGWQAAEAGEHALGIEVLRELIPIAQATDLPTLHMRLASFLSSGPGDLVAATAQVNEAVRLFTDAGAEDRLASALNELAWIRGESGDLAAQISGSREALRRAEAIGDETLVLHSLGSIGYALASRADADAPDVLRRSTAIAFARGDGLQTSWHNGTLGLALLLGGRVDEATRVLDGIIDAGSVRSALPFTHRAFLNYLLGRWDLALADHRALEALHPSSLPAFAGWTATIAGLIETLSRQDAIGARHLEETTRLYATSDFYWAGAMHEWARGVADALRGDLRTAETRIARGVERTRMMGARPIELIMLTDLVEVRVAASDLTGAAAASARVSALSDELATILASAHAAYASGILALANGRRQAGTTLRQAADLAASLGLRPLRARALEQLARASDGGERVRLLTDAARAYAELGAKRYEERAMSELRGLGAAGRRSAQTVGALTPREREIAALAKQGLGNKDIAARLDLSERTVESHLAHIYGKLGVAGRDQLSEASF